MVGVVAATSLGWAVDMHELVTSIEVVVFLWGLRTFSLPDQRLWIFRDPELCFGHTGSLEFSSALVTLDWGLPVSTPPRVTSLGSFQSFGISGAADTLQAPSRRMGFSSLRDRFRAADADKSSGAFGNGRWRLGSIKKVFV